jgi:iron complex transport system substrate-binding protein
VYERVLQRALLRRGLTVERQLFCDFEYDGMLFRRAIRLDLFIEGSIAVELKAEKQPSRDNKRQQLNQLQLLNLPLCLLINFGLPQLRQGIRRLVNGLEE